MIIVERRRLNLALMILGHDERERKLNRFEVFRMLFVERRRRSAQEKNREETGQGHD